MDEIQRVGGRVAVSLAACAALLAPAMVLADFPCDWTLWMPVTVTEQSGNTLNSYQVKVVFDSATLISEGKMQADCRDIRFADASAAPIPYWLEGGCNTPDTAVWVLVPSIPASGSVTVRLYSGNPGATSVSNGAATFPLLFDDGEGRTDGQLLSAGGWTAASGVEACQIYSDHWWFCNGAWSSCNFLALRLEGESTCKTCYGPGQGYQDEHEVSRYFTPALDRYAIDWAFLDMNDGDTFEVLRAGNPAAETGYVFGVGMAAGEWTLDYAGGAYIGCNGNYFATPNVAGQSTCAGTVPRSAGWHTATATFINGCWRQFIDGVSVRDCPPLPTGGDYITWLQLRNGRRESCSFGSSWYDVIRVRDYVEPEPTVYVGAIPVTIDIKPGTFPNCINNNGKGVIPVAVMGASEFDAREIDPATLKLAGMPVKLDKKGRPAASYSDVNLDGFIDLVVQITNVAGAIPAGTTTATLTGSLSNGTPIEGSDSICLVK